MMNLMELLKSIFLDAITKSNKDIFPQLVKQVNNFESL
nr:hypothetical protein QCQ_0326 [Clostridioides difficile CD49]